jgi:hypothetical protein
MKGWIRVMAGVALAVPLAVLPGWAQPPATDPGPDEERMPAMMRMMREMHGDMDRMRAEMRGEGMHAMRERMQGMAKRMERMTGMMERHQRRLESGCPAMAPKEPKTSR